MYKYFTFLLLFLTTGLFAQDITATQKIPKTAMPGTEFTVETTIYKAGVTGFMKFFQEIPEGFTATEIESKAGAFTFADGGAKIVWISPPSDEVFTISYKVTVNGGVSGLKAFPGKISYINNNERKVFDLPAASVQIGLATAPVQKTIPSTNPVTTTQPVKTTPVATTQPVKTSPVTTTQPTSTTPAVTTPIKSTPPAQKKFLYPARQQPLQRFQLQLYQLQLEKCIEYKSVLIQQNLKLMAFQKFLQLF